MTEVMVRVGGNVDRASPVILRIGKAVYKKMKRKRKTKTKTKTNTKTTRSRVGDAEIVAESHLQLL